MSCTGFVRFRKGTIQVVSRCEQDSEQMGCIKCGLFLNFRNNKFTRRALLHGVIYVYKILPFTYHAQLQKLPIYHYYIVFFFGCRIMIQFQQALRQQMLLIFQWHIHLHRNNTISPNHHTRTFLRKLLVLHPQEFCAASITVNGQELAV